MKKLITRLLIGLMFALPFGLVTTVWAQADAPDTYAATPEMDCQSCHADFYETWEHSAHGQAMSDPEFEDAWHAQGNKSECLQCHTTGYDLRTNVYESKGITCEACHGPVAAGHPDEPMPSDRSAYLCGDCHIETLFEWQASSHREANLACVDCHGQHGTTIKAEDEAALCANCHRDRSSNFGHTAHSDEGLTCADCHLGPTSAQTGEGHAVRDHSFQVRLSTCNECHAYQMHDPSDVHLDEFIEPELDAMASVEIAGVSADPEPVSPVYFALLSALIGMAFGLVISPWIERWYRRLTLENKELER